MADTPPEADVLVGRFDWLFLVGGSNDVLAQYSPPSSFTPYLAEVWIQRLVARHHRAEQLGMAYHHVIVPEKLGVYPELSGISDRIDPEAAPAWALPRAVLVHPMSRVLDHVLVDVRGPLRAVRGRTPLYWRTDSHWTPEGAYVAYEQLCLRLGVTPRRDLPQRPEIRADLVLDLGSQVSDHPTETFRMRDFVQEARRSWINGVVAFKEAHGRDNDAGLHVGSAVRFENDDAPSDLSVLMFGDSFAEYRPTLLTGMLAETFRRVTFVWSSSVDWELVEREHPDVLLTQLAERFHVVVPDDTFSLERLERDLLTSITSLPR